LSLLLSAATVFAVPAQRPALEQALRLDTITIVVTDSGLGGLSVVAELEHQLRASGGFSHVTLVFANALPDVDRTYNGMATRHEQVDVFNRALDGMIRGFRPDVILVACNTLSTLIPDTQVWRTGRVPVVGIIEAGVEAIDARLRADASALALVLGTPITIRSAAHREGLAARGVARARVHEQACPNLESEIQNEPDSDLTRGYIEAYADDAARALSGRAHGAIVAALCCSHYGYSEAVFRDVLRQQFGPHVVVVNPNTELTRSFMARVRRGVFRSTGTTVRVVSRALLTEQEREAIARTVARQSVKTAAALKAYERKRDLFDMPS
jgi:glutamate racemase